jgi:hypothetical protein
MIFSPQRPQARLSRTLGGRGALLHLRDAEHLIKGWIHEALLQTAHAVPLKDHFAPCGKILPQRNHAESMKSVASAWKIFNQLENNVFLNREKGRGKRNQFNLSSYSANL